MNVLSIGNSFSQDAQRYLNGIAKSAGVNLNCFNLYIGGCPLSRHFRNMHSGERAYTLEMNGTSTVSDVPQIPEKDFASTWSTLVNSSVPATAKSSMKKIRVHQSTSCSI